jgi:hypothetical protein
MRDDQFRFKFGDNGRLRKSLKENERRVGGQGKLSREKEMAMDLMQN